MDGRGVLHHHQAEGPGAARALPRLASHYIRRDVMAWRPLLEDYKAATGDGVKR